MKFSEESQVDVLIKNGLVVTESQTMSASVAIHDEKILGLLDRDFPIHAKTVVDAAGKWILPGTIDAHTHFRHMHQHADDLGDVSRSAAFGGVTTIVSAISFDRKILVEEGINSFIDAQKGRCFTDFGFHLRLFPEQEFANQVPKAIKLGVSSFKISLGYKKRGLVFPDDLIFSAMEVIRDHKGILMVHAENGVVIDLLENRFFEQKSQNPLILARSRPPYTEAEAISRMRWLAGGTGCPVYIVHLSTALGLDEAKRTREAGARFFIETCPQYLLLNEEVLLTMKGLAKIGPPLREITDNQSLWDGLKNDLIDTMGSDHVGYKKSKKQDMISAPFGAPGVETLLGLMLSEGVLKKRISINRLVQVLCSNPARIFGMYPQKGSLQPGSDADLVIIDPNEEYVIKAETQHTNADFSLYEDWKLKGKPVMTLLRGKVLLNRDRLEQQAGYGKFIQRRCPDIAYNQ